MVYLKIIVGIGDMCKNAANATWEATKRNVVKVQMCISDFICCKSLYWGYKLKQVNFSK